MAAPLPVIADVPNANPGLGFTEYADAIADAIRGGAPPQFTIGLYGAWGSGKSSLLAAIYQRLNEPASGVLPVLFDAWRYERVDHIVVPLLHHMYRAADTSGRGELKATLGRALGAVINSLKFNLGVVDIDLGKGKESWDDAAALAPLDKAFSQPFAELRNITQVLGEERIAVLIDDLDRCSPSNVVTLLEAINLIMDVPGVIFVLALDYDVIVDAVATRYPHVSGHAFIEKIIQLPFRVPRLDVTDDLLQDLIPDWSSLRELFPQRVVERAGEIAELGLGSNPRQIKRFVNAYLVIHRVIQARGVRVEGELVAALIALQLAWPEEHRAVQRAVFLENSDPLGVLQEARTKDPALDAFLDRFLSGGYASPRKLRTVLQLTAVVVAPSSDVRLPLSGPADQVREEHRTQLLNHLDQNGFEQSPRSETLYYHDRLKNIRFRFRKHNVNLERRDPTAPSERQWTTEKQFLLTRDIERAMEAISTAQARRRRK